MHARSVVIVMTGCALGLIALSVVGGKTPLIFWNTTASVPRGLYIVTHAAAPRRGDLVAAWLPSATRVLAAERRYVPVTVPVIKPVFAVAGDTVCATESAVFVEGAEVAPRLANDHTGRPLPSWTGCRSLAADEVLLLSTHSPDSFDGRYFGPTSRAAVIAVLRPLWTY